MTKIPDRRQHAQLRCERADRCDIDCRHKTPHEPFIDCELPCLHCFPLGAICQPATGETVRREPWDHGLTAVEEHYQYHDVDHQKRESDEEDEG